MKYLLAIGFILFFCFSTRAEHGDTLLVNFNWNGINFSPEEAGKPTLNLQDGIYISDYNYLPAKEIKGLVGKIQRVYMLSFNRDTLATGEKSIVQRLYQQNFKQVQLKHRQLGALWFSDLLILPIGYDTTSNEFYKITSAKIVYDGDNTVLKPNFTSNRVSSNQSSVLADGDWYKIAVAENGVYKLDRNFLKDMGIDVDHINPQNIKIYGNGGGMLPQRNDAPRIADLYENAIEVAGETDKNFDENDYILFYGQSPHKLSFNSDASIDYQHNIYSDTTYYFLTISGSKGKRLPSRGNSGTSLPLIDSYNDLQVHELNKTNILSSGREWFGERFDATSSYGFDFDLDGIIPNSDLDVRCSVLSQSYTATTMDVLINGANVGSINLPSIPDKKYNPYAVEGAETEKSFTYAVKANEGKNFSVDLKFNKVSGVKSAAYLNYIVVSSERSLVYDGRQLSFLSLQSMNNSSSTFQIRNFSSTLEIWDLTDPLNPGSQPYNLAETTAKFGAETTTLKKFIAFDPKNAPSPLFIKKVDNQNLRAQAVPDLIIITYPGFISEAERLASHRESHDGLDVLITTPEKIYNEFSSGMEDVTAIRDFAKYFFDKGNKQKLKNLLLFGKCSYDYKDRKINNANFVPIYSSRNSVDPLKSYSSDDYYCFLEDGEGEWEESYSGDHTLDIGVGRLPVTSKKEAAEVVDKLIAYDLNPGSFGDWRNRITIIAEGDNSNTFERDAEDLSGFLDTAQTRFNINKIYIDAYPELETASGKSAPEVNQAINNTISNGSLLVNYIGHGSETRLANKTVIDINMIRKWSNFEKLPLFITATCEFGRHDNPSITSGAEYLLLNPTGGAIGLVTTSRLVYSNTNYDINLAFYKSVFERDASGYFDMGTIFKNTKNRSLRGVNNRNFVLLGDPSMKLAVAKNKAEIIVSTDYSKNPGDTLKAMELVKLHGRITDHEGSILNGFNGTLTATVFDKAQQLETLGHDGPVFTYDSRRNIIFKGDASVKDGKFTLQFVVPKAISYNLEKGKISLYAFNENLSSDAAGSDLTFTVGGTGEFEADNDPPSISLFINDTTFIDKGLSGDDPVAVAKIFDENGINILNDKINQGIIISLDNEDFRYAGDFFKNALDDYKTGWLNYPFFDVDDGYHKITVGAYDTHNNYSEKELSFYVSESEKFVVDNLMNYPNPFSDETTISFEQNRPGEDLEYYLDIYNLNGIKVFSRKYVTLSSPGRIDNIVWTGETSSGKKIEPGIYVYVVTVRSHKDSANIRVSNKLLIIN